MGSGITTILGRRLKGVWALVGAGGIATFVGFQADMTPEFADINVLHVHEANATPQRPRTWTIIIANGEPKTAQNVAWSIRAEDNILASGTLRQMRGGTPHHLTFAPPAGAAPGQLHLCVAYTEDLYSKLALPIGWTTRLTMQRNPPPAPGALAVWEEESRSDSGVLRAFSTPALGAPRCG